MIRGLRCGSLIGVLLLGLACGAKPPTGPGDPPPPTVTPPPEAAPAESSTG